MARRKAIKETVIIVLAVLLIIETGILIKFWPRKPKIIPKPAPVEVAAKIAIIIDDWGYSLSNISSLKEINIPLDISVLPFLPYSKKAAYEARLNNKEVMLHLPLEPHPNSQIRLENKVILTNMKQQEIIKILNDALKSVAYARGVNNHMGSLATENKDVMAVIFKEIRKKGLFFVDSLVTVNTICSELAEELQVKFGQRSVFLDNKSDAEYIRNQFYKLVKVAKSQGYAIGIGHDHALTLKVIKELVPGIERQGIKFVFVSELVK